MEFEVGNQVMLSTENLLLKSGQVKKLAPKFLGPLTIVKKTCYWSSLPVENARSLVPFTTTFHNLSTQRYVPDVFNRQDTPKTSHATKNFMNISEILNPEQ